MVPGRGKCPSPALLWDDGPPSMPNGTALSNGHCPCGHQCPPLSMSKPLSNIPLSMGGGGLEPPDNAPAASISWAASRYTFQIFMTMSSTASPGPVAWLNEPAKLDKSILSLAQPHFSISCGLYV